MSAFSEAITVNENLLEDLQQKFQNNNLSSIFVQQESSEKL